MILLLFHLGKCRGEVQSAVSAAQCPDEDNKDGKILRNSPETLQLCEGFCSSVFSEDANPALPPEILPGEVLEWCRLLAGGCVLKLQSCSQVFRIPKL